MAVNPSIALAARPVEIASPLEQYGKIAAIQHAQNQNALAQYQLGAAQRAEAKDIARTNALSQAGNDEGAIANALLKAGDLAGYTSFIKSNREANKAQVDLLDAKLKQSRAFLDTINPTDPDAPQQYLAWHQANHADPVLGPALNARGISADQTLGRIQRAIQAGPQAFAELLNQSKLGAEKFMELNKPQLITSNLGKTTETTAYSPLTNKVEKVLSQTNTIAPAEAERIRLEGQRVGLEGRRVAVLEENQRRDADPAFQQRMAGARVMGEALAKGDVAAQQALPQVISRAEDGIRLIDELVGKRDAKGKLIDGSKPHPGFEDAVGATWMPGARFVPGTNAAGFMSRFDQIKGSSFLEAFQTLRGGGAITEKEGQKATDAINRMSIATDEKEFIRAAVDLQDVIRKGVAEAQRKASKSSTPAVGNTPAAAGNIDALLEKYK